MITGSNGKTTTTELVGHIHRQAGVAVAVAGNVGTALTTLPGTIDRSAVVVCEASSFQLEDTEAFAPEAAVLLNLAEDHLDRYATSTPTARPSCRPSRASRRARWLSRRRIWWASSAGRPSA